MDPKGFEKKPWFPYVKNMYDQIEEDIMSVDAKGYEEKPWWPYVLDLQEKIDSGGGGSSDFSTATVTINSGESTLSVLWFPAVYDVEGLALCVPMSNYASLLTASVVLYKGKGVMSINPTSNPSAFNVTTTGNCEYDPEMGVIVTGDGTINITYIG